MNTKEMILETALNLFNKNGSYTVTTRHIAAEMNISPGNLYYHYRNKEEIIRVLLERMIGEFNIFIRPSDCDPDIAGQLTGAISKAGKVMYDYRFFFMEMSTLLEKDPVLKKMYMKIKHERHADFRSIFQNLEQAGFFIEPFTDEEFSIVLENIWSLCEFLLQSMYMNRIKITPENILKNFFRVMYIIRPYLKKEFRNLFSDFNR